MNFETYLVFYIAIALAYLPLYLLDRYECMEPCEVVETFPFEKHIDLAPEHCQEVYKLREEPNSIFKLYHEEATLAFNVLKKIYMWTQESNGEFTSLADHLRVKLYTKVKFQECEYMNTTGFNEQASCVKYIKCSINKMRLAEKELGIIEAKIKEGLPYT